ncbi:MAG: helicase C-terminal domain-containing protein [Candidatus Hodarchaeales archaeon]
MTKSQSDKYRPPFTFYTPQKVYTKIITETMMKGRIVLLEAGTGFGKTIANLYGAFLTLESGKDLLIYLSRTHEQNEQIVKELDSLNDTNFPEVRTGLQIASRHQLCHVQEVREAPTSIASDLCREMRKMRKKGIRKARNCCALSTVKEEEDLMVKIPLILNLQNLRTIAADAGCCAYLTCREMVGLHDVVSGSYLYFLHDSIRESIGLPLKNAKIILDEGHNLEAVLEDVYSRRLNSFQLKRAIDEVQLISNYILGSFLENIRDLFGYLSKNSSESGIPYSCLDFIDMCSDFSIDQTAIENFIEDVSRSREDIINEKKKSRHNKTVSFLNVDNVCSFLENIFLSPENFGIITRSTGRGFSVVLQCLNPALPFETVVQNAKSVVICSGTLTPLDLQQEILGIPSAIKKQFGSIINPENALILVISNHPDGQRLTTSYEYRNENPEVFKHYKQAINEIMKNLPAGGGLAFFPSYNIMDQVLLSDNTRKGFTYYVESRDPVENSSIFQDYKTEIKSGKQALLCGVFGGKFAEGANFPGNLARAVMVCGIPYPPPDPYIKLKRSFYEHQKNGLGKEWYKAQAFRRVAQALGRGWRNKDDFAMGFLLDYRFSSHSSRSQFPLWLETRMKNASNWASVKLEMGKFFQSKAIQ